MSQEGFAPPYSSFILGVLLCLVSATARCAYRMGHLATPRAGLTIADAIISTRYAIVPRRVMISRPVMITKPPRPNVAYLDVVGTSI